MDGDLIYFTHVEVGIARPIKTVLKMMSSFARRPANFQPVHSCALSKSWSLPYFFAHEPTTQSSDERHNNNNGKNYLTTSTTNPPAR